MRNAVFAVALGLGLAAFLAPGHAYAMLGVETVNVHVPFAFDVNGYKLPAGNYVLQQEDMSQPNVLKLTSRDKAADETPVVLFAVRNESPVQANSKTEFVFYRYGKQDFLHAVEMPDAPAHVLEPSKAEREAARRETRLEHRVEASPASSR